MFKISIVAVIVLLVNSATLSAQPAHLKVADTFHIKSGGGWDYITADPLSEKLYVSHGSQVNVLNKNTGDSIGIIPNTTGVHGIALIQKLNKGYTSNGRLNNVSVFDLKTLEVKKQIATGENPDAIFYDDFSGNIITCNGRSKSLTVIDPIADTVVANIPLSGKPETAVSDGKGKVYVNNEDKSEIEVVDMKRLAVINSWPLAPGEAPTGLCIDRATGRLFAACDNKLLMVLDVATGKVVAKLPIGEGCDGAAFDPAYKIIYASNGATGTLTVIKEVSKDKFTVLENVPTKASARTLCVDTQTHTVYLPAADFGATEPGARRAPMIPGTFKILVVK